MEKLDNMWEFRAGMRLFDLKKEMAKILDQLDAYQRTVVAKNEVGRPLNYPFESIHTNQAFGFKCSIEKITRLVRSKNRKLAPKLFVLQTEWDCGVVGPSPENCRVVRLQ